LHSSPSVQTRWHEHLSLSGTPQEDHAPTAPPGKLDAGYGALMKAAMAAPAIAAHKKDAPKYAQKLAKAAHSLSAEVLGRDEFETLVREKAYLQAALGVPVVIYSADDAGEDPRARASRRNRGGRRFISSEASRSFFMRLLS